MFRRMLCLLCAALMLMPALTASAENTEGLHSYDFDLTFSLNTDSFPKLLRSRASGYAQLINRLGLRGNLAWSEQTQSMELDVSIYYTDRENLTFPFTLYGTRSRLFLTSRAINNQVLFLNLASAMEFASKAKETLSIPLPYFAFLIPYSTEFAFSGMVDAWNRQIKSFKKSARVSVKKLKAVSTQWKVELSSNANLQRWLMTLEDGSDAPAAIQSVFDVLPVYYKTISGNKALVVTVEPDSLIWRNTAGDTLFFRQESEDDFSAALSLPPMENGYIPSFTLLRQANGDTDSFTFEASMLRNTEEETDLPACLIQVNAEASGLPRLLPMDTGFSFSASVLGAVYPNLAFRIEGETKSDGSVALSVFRTGETDEPSEEMLRCAGTVLPAELRTIPDYQNLSTDDMYNVFSFNEETLSAFSHRVLPLLVKSLFAFVEAAPTAACQSFLDDLTDIGLLDMLISQ